MSNSYVLLEKIVVPAAGASSVTFANIPQTGYTDLVVKMSVRGNNSSGSQFTISFNGSTSGYTDKLLEGNGATTSSYSNAGGTGTGIFAGSLVASSQTASTFNSGEVYIPNYASSNNKSVSVDYVSENNATTSYADLTAGLWSNSAAITSITFAPSSGVSFVANSTFYLYGVAKLGTTPTIAPKATGGDVVMTDGTYWYHAFRSSGTFTPAVALSCDALVVAGGGGGGGAYAGGGGAGGLLGFTSQALSVTGYTVTVGAGGAGGAQNVSGTTGSDSQFGALTLVKGGGGGGNGGATATNIGLNGGSGGGGGRNAFLTPTDAAGGSATSGQGFAGGTYVNATSGNVGAGGGGSGAAGGSQTSAGNVGGIGGVGLSTYSSWGLATTTGQNVSGTVYYAGGGGGGAFSAATAAGTGGYGGGANGGYGVSGASGTANTGGGGGGGGGNTSYAGGTGGSGIVIVRYLVA